MIMFKRWTATWTLKRNYSFRRKSNMTGTRILPFAMMQVGVSKIMFNAPMYYVSADEFIILKLKGEV